MESPAIMTAVNEIRSSPGIAPAAAQPEDITAQFVRTKIVARWKTDQVGGGVTGRGLRPARLRCGIDAGDRRDYLAARNCANARRRIRRQVEYRREALSGVPRPRLLIGISLQLARRHADREMRR